MILLSSAAADTFFLLKIRTKKHQNMIQNIRKTDRCFAKRKGDVSTLYKYK